VLHVIIVALREENDPLRAAVCSPVLLQHFILVPPVVGVSAALQSFAAAAAVNSSSKPLIYAFKIPHCCQECSLLFRWPLTLAFRVVDSPTLRALEDDDERDATERGSPKSCVVSIPRCKRFFFF
jgi:hypothetical protein